MQDHIDVYLHWRQFARDLPFAALFTLSGLAMMSGVLFLAVADPIKLLSWQALTAALGGPTCFLMGAPLFYDIYQWMRSRPVMTFSRRGLFIDAGPFDRHFIAWQDMEAISSTLLSEYRDLYENIPGLSKTFVATSIRCRDDSGRKRRRLPSRIYHSWLDHMLDFGYELEPLDEADLVRLRALVKANVPSIQPSLICDW